MVDDKKYITAQAHEPLKIKNTVLRFSKDRLPPVRQTYESELGCQLSRPEHRGEVSGPCCFHESKSRRSFKVNLESGLWYCHGCQTGGDMVAFIQRRHGFTFTEAARYLGALEETGQPSPAPVLVPINYLVFDYVVDGAEYRAEVKDEPRSYAGVIRNFRREASDQLTSLGLAKAESAEAETNWIRLALATAELWELGTL
jgi:CHC2-type zinc finger protein